MRDIVHNEIHDRELFSTTEFYETVLAGHENGADILKSSFSKRNALIFIFVSDFCSRRKYCMIAANQPLRT